MAPADGIGAAAKKGLRQVPLAARGPIRGPCLHGTGLTQASEGAAWYEIIEGRGLVRVEHGGITVLDVAPEPPRGLGTSGRRELDLFPVLKIDYDMNLSLDPVGESCIRYVALLIEGRLRRQSRWRSEAWRPAAAACNRRLGRQGTPPARHYDLAARSVAARMRRKCRKRKRGPGRKSPRWSAERRASPRHGGAGAFAKAPRRARLRHVAGARHAPERLSALRHPSIGVELEFQTPGA